MTVSRAIAGNILRSLSRGPSRRCIHRSAPRYAVTNMQMPAMSPTMTEGGIASWKKKEGESFAAGDVLLEIETDKATIDVEAQDDGIMGKILAPDGAKNVKVGKVIALLAEEGDDISNLEAPKEEETLPAKEENKKDLKPEVQSTSTSASAKQPTASSSSSPSPPQHTSKHPEHSRPLFPSVSRLLVEFGVENPEKIKGTGVRGMLTKGDVLAYLGKASGPTGTYKEAKKDEKVVEVKEKKEEYKPLDGLALRSLITQTLLQNSLRSRNVAPGPTPDFNSIIADYLPPAPHTASAHSVLPAPKPKTSTTNYLEGLI